MATYIDVITGFLESGKTTFIKELIDRNSFSEYKTTVLILCEEGKIEYEENLMTVNGLKIITLGDATELTDPFFQRIKNEFSPEHVMIEFNGTWDINLLFNLKIPFEYQFRNIIFISEANTFKNFLINMAAVIQPHILNSDVVIFNRAEDLEKKQKIKLQQDVKNINKKAEIIYSGELEEEEKINKYFVPKEKYIKISKSTIIAVLILVVIALLPKSLLLMLYGVTQSVATIFISILIEAIPFILLGAFLSSMIQILIPSGWIMKKISQNNYSSFVIASFAGLFMPICDCGTVPIVSGLLKKDAPLPQTITFWLASSAVNPVVLLSVYYAFPDQPYLILIRMISGILIALVTGLILMSCKIQTKEEVTQKSRTQSIGTDMLELRQEGKIRKIEAVVKGAKFEFFRVIKYVIVGAFISALLQTILPQTMKSFIGSNLNIQFLIMIIAAIFMSTCSTSNAFIGRSFLRMFSMIPVMSFMVLGPMLDFKNMIMLSEILKKRFLIVLAFLVGFVGFIVFYSFALYF
jgi:uncharacterized membrane protein YraQ (UPF0718 family)